MWIVYMEPEEIRRAIDIIHPRDELFECRILGNDGRNYSGYFRGADELIGRLSSRSLQNCNVYITLQRLHEGCEARTQWEHFEESGGRGKLVATSDNDVIGYNWIPIDIDPVRPAAISSDSDELEEALEVCNFVKYFMLDHGHQRYIFSSSGNGYHLLFAVQMDKATGEHYISELLKQLDGLFSSGRAHVDTVNSNPARIWKLYGTLAQKGRSTPDRPHRIARILEVQGFGNS